VFDSWAGELSPASFKKFSQPYLEYIAKHLPLRLKEKGLEPVPMVVFPKGAWYALDAACNMGYNIVGLDWLHDPAEAVKTVGDRPIVLQGNADPGVLYGSHAAITEAVTEMVKGFGWAYRRKGWIVNLGHGTALCPFPGTQVADVILGITPFVNPDDLKFFFQEIHRLTKTDAQ
jgi:uroporphyrinogen decarboxylase